MELFSAKSIRFIRYRLPVVALCTVIFWQSSFPSAISDPPFPHHDKILHFLVYGILAALVARDIAVNRPELAVSRLCFFAALFSGLYGLSDEIHQWFVQQRVASIGDFAADFSGSIAGAFVYSGLCLEGISK